MASKTTPEAPLRKDNPTQVPVSKQKAPKSTPSTPYQPPWGPRPPKAK